jgi:tetratricopeptide (TPR) repeat protein
MNVLAKPLTICLLCLGFLGAPGRLFAQVVGSSHKHIAQDPEAVALGSLLADAQAALDRKDFAAAARNYQSYLDKKPDDAAVHFQLGYAFVALQKLDDAKAQYQKAIDLNPKMGEAYLNLGLTLLDSDPSAAIAPLQKAVELLPNQPRPEFALGAAYERSKKPSQAIEQYQAAEKLDDQDFETHLAVGRLLLGANRPAQAEPEFRAALAARKDSAPARFGLAQSLAAQKKTDAAAEAFQAYLALAPHDRAAELDRASLLFNGGKLDESLAALDHAASGGPEDLPALKLRALIYMQKQQFADAVSVLLKAITAAPQDPDLPAELGHAYLKKKDYPSAVQELVVAINANPRSIDVLNDLVIAEYLNKNYSAALSGLDILAKHEDLTFGSWFIRATCYDKLGQAAPALDAYQKFLQLNKDETSDMYFEAAARARTLARELKDKKR